jgi:hypothetical protein
MFGGTIVEMVPVSGCTYGRKGKNFNQIDAVTWRTPDAKITYHKLSNGKGLTKPMEEELVEHQHPFLIVEQCVFIVLWDAQGAIYAYEPTFGMCYSLWIKTKGTTKILVVPSN